MISTKQLEANRRNAALSTGPRTAAGKAAVRFNVLRHGLRARAILLPGEQEEDLRQLCADLQSDWNPQNRTEQLLVEQMAVAPWKLARFKPASAASSRKRCRPKGNSPSWIGSRCSGPAWSDRSPKLCGNCNICRQRALPASPLSRSRPKQRQPRITRQ
jgi:hypothetical protein